MLGLLGKALSYATIGVRGIFGVAFLLFIYGGFLLWLFRFAEGTIEAMSRAKWDLSPPTSIMEVVSGLFLAVFVGGTLSIGIAALLSQHLLLDRR